MAQGVNAAGNLLSAYTGFQRGGIAGNAGGVASLASAYNNLYGNNNGASIPYVGTAGNILGIYNGIKTGGVAGYGSAAINAGQLAGVSGLGYVAAPLAVYNAAANFRSGATTSDALSGAAAGAAVGSIIPGVGTIIGGVVGGLIGAGASAFGGGITAAETKNWNGFINATGGANATQAQVNAATQNMSPQSAFNLLTGVMDIHDKRIPFVNAFGRMNESDVLNQMTSQINSAIKAGTISKGATPQEMYTQVVEPWLNSKGATITPQTGGLQLQGVLQSLIGSWQNGSLTSMTQLASGGQSDKTLPVFGG